MISLRILLLRLRGMLGKSRSERELVAELQAHLDLLTEENIRKGMNAEEARCAARREFGGLEQSKQLYRDQRGFPFVDALLQDLRFALRMLAKSPGFVCAAMLTLALGIGANTVIFSAVNAILLQPLPYANASKLVTIRGFRRFSGVEATTFFSTSTWKIIREQSHFIEQMGVYSRPSLALTGLEAPEQLQAALVDGSFFSTLGVTPVLGRPILDADTQPGNADVAVVSYALWREILGSDPGVLNRNVTLDGKRYRVIGVMPRGFEFGSDKRGVWLPFAPEPGKEVTGAAVARLRSGVTIEQANAQLKLVGAGISDKLSNNMKWELLAIGVKEDLVGNVRHSLLILLAAVGFVLLIACVNVSGLLLARSWTRQREVAIRSALGATRFRIVRQFLAESVLLALAGGFLGLLLSVWGVRGLRLIAPAETPRLEDLKLDPAVLCFTLGISLLAGLAFGLAPALQISREGPSDALKGASGSSLTSVKKTHRLRSLLVIAEIALAVILVIGASLMARSLFKMTTVDLGFRTDHILTMRVNFSEAVCDADKGDGCARTAAAVVQGLRGVSGVQGAAVVSALPVDEVSFVLSFEAEGQPGEVGLEQGVWISDRVISPDYFRTMGLRLLAGRALDENDREGAPHVVVVNEVLAKRFFSGSPLGHRIALPNSGSKPKNWLLIVGEVSDSHDSQLDHKPIAEFYTPLAQSRNLPSPSFVVRTAADPMVMAAAVRQQVWAIDKSAPITDLRTMDQVVAGTVAEPRFQTLLLSGFGILGFVLAMFGIYGVISYAVGQRTHEIGIRMALGARPQEVLWMVIGEGMLLAGAGVLAGLGGSLALTKFLNNLLYETKPTDPATFLCVAIALTLMALLACYVPARRATRVDPLVALRYE
jgi:putative ABC transport system permease protein